LLISELMESYLIRFKIHDFTDFKYSFCESLIEHSISLILPCTLEKSSPLNSYFSFKENADTLKSNKSFKSFNK